MTGEGPTISVVICTRDRPESFRRALDSVLEQDLLPDEVIVVDGSRPPVELPEGACVPLRLITGERWGEGRARAAGLRAAQGELVAWCDDDDEWLPGHLRRLRDALLDDPGADLACTTDGRALDWDAGRGRRVPVRPPALFEVYPGDVLHRAAAARAVGGFDLRLLCLAGGDLWSRIAAERKVVRLPGPLTVHHDLPGVATPVERKLARDWLWRDWLDVSKRTRETRQRLHARAGRVVPFNPDTWREGRRELLFQTLLNDVGSFALVAGRMIRALQAAGVGVTLGPLRETSYSPQWESVTGPADPQDRLALVYDWRSGAAGPRSERVVLYTMWETTIAPPYHVEEINAAATMIYVPCRENVRVARDSGIEVPARVLVHGVNREQFPYLERPRPGGAPFTFGTYGVFSPRKGIDVLVRAFREEFAPDEPVRLALKKIWGRAGDVDLDDPRIVQAGGFIQHEDLLEFLRGLDAYVLPSRGEGFGLTGLEAMATGLPLIATNWSGPVEYLDPADTYPLRYRLEEVGGEHFGLRRQWGLWAEPNLSHLRQLMRHLYEHRVEAADAGRRASARVHRDWTWRRVAEQIIADFDLLARGLTPAE